MALGERAEASRGVGWGRDTPSLISIWPWVSSLPCKDTSSLHTAEIRKLRLRDGKGGFAKGHPVMKGQAVGIWGCQDRTEVFLPGLLRVGHPQGDQISKINESIGLSKGSPKVNKSLSPLGFRNCFSSLEREGKCTLIEPQAEAQVSLRPPWLPAPQDPPAAVSRRVSPQRDLHKLQKEPLGAGSGRTWLMAQLTNPPVICPRHEAP